MNYFTTSLMKSLFNNDNNLPAFEQAVSELFRSELEKSLNEILAYELTAFLDYEPYQRTDKENSRNGFYQRKLDTKYGPLTLRIPRDRLVNSLRPLSLDIEDVIFQQKPPSLIFLKKE